MLLLSISIISYDFHIVFYVLLMLYFNSQILLLFYDKEDQTCLLTLFLCKDGVYFYRFIVLGTWLIQTIQSIQTHFQYSLYLQSKCSSYFSL